GKVLCSKGPPPVAGKKHPPESQHDCEKDHHTHHRLRPGAIEETDEWAYGNCLGEPALPRETAEKDVATGRMGNAVVGPGQAVDHLLRHEGAEVLIIVAEASDMAAQGIGEQALGPPLPAEVEGGNRETPGHQ